MRIYCRYNSPIGDIILTGENNYLTGLYFDNQKLTPDFIQPDYEEGLLPVFDETKKWLDIYFSGSEPTKDPPVKLSGSKFQLDVWGLLQSIPYGQTVSYGDIAKKLSEYYGIEKMSAQAVGMAVGHNPVSIIIPCHRVIGSDGSLTGYGGGIERKIFLLRLEGKTVVNNIVI